MPTLASIGCSAIHANSAIHTPIHPSYEANSEAVANNASCQESHFRKIRELATNSDVA